MNRYPQNKNDNEEESEKKRFRFNLFERIRREQAGVSPDEPRVIDEPTFFHFFKLLGQKITSLLYVNLFFVFGNFPVFFGLFAMTGYVSAESFSPYYQQYAPLLGASYFDSSPVVASLLGVFGIHAKISVPTTATTVFYALALLTLLTFGIVNVGTTYLIRSMIREESVFLWQDFWYAVRRNWKQALPFGAFDLGIIALLVYDFIYFYLNLTAGTLIYIFFFLTFSMIIVYSMMRMYIYLMMITFDLSVMKLLKNAISFTILGIKRNIMALFGIVVLVALNYVLLTVFVPIGVIIPFILLFSVSAFIAAYAAYPIIKKYMIDPYYDEKGNPIQSKKT
jgi:uncharacterized membrane protein YesL